jgi:hypothetical protein
MPEIKVEGTGSRHATWPAIAQAPARLVAGEEQFSGLEIPVDHASLVSRARYRAPLSDDGADPRGGPIPGRVLPPEAAEKLRDVLRGFSQLQWVWRIRPEYSPCG